MAPSPPKIIVIPSCERIFSPIAIPVDTEKLLPKMLDDVSDPIFVLEKQVGSKKIEEITKTVLKELNSEIK